MKSKEHNADKDEKKQWNTTTAKKKNITTKVRKQGWMTHLQTRRYMKTKDDHEETKWRKKPVTRQPKKPCYFSPVFLATRSDAPKKDLNNNFSANKNPTDEWKMGRQLTTWKSENFIFSLAFWRQTNPRVNKRPPRCGVSFIELSYLADIDVFGPSFSEVQFHRLSAPKRYYTIKLVVSALCGQRKNEWKSRSFKS